MDLMHGAAFVRPVAVSAGGYADCAGAQIVVITAGAAQKPGETRLELRTQKHRDLPGHDPADRRGRAHAILLIVANPVDILTYAALKFSGFPASRVVGSGTVLDTARLRALIGQRLGIDPRSVHAYVVGEHGDTEVVLWSRATVAGLPISEFCAQRGGSCDSEMRDEIATRCCGAAYEIIERKGATYYGIGLGIRSVVEAMLRDQNTVLTVSTLMTGQLDVADICLSLPCVVDRGGVEGVLVPAMSDEEATAFSARHDVCRRRRERQDCDYGRRTNDRRRNAFVVLLRPSSGSYRACRHPTCQLRIRHRRRRSRRRPSAAGSWCCWA